LIYTLRQGEPKNGGKSKTIQFSKCGSSGLSPLSLPVQLVPPDSMAQSQSVAHKRNSFADFLLKAFFELS